MQAKAAVLIRNVGTHGIKIKTEMSAGDARKLLLQKEHIFVLANVSWNETGEAEIEFLPGHEVMWIVDQSATPKQAEPTQD